jgi:hypothetical protein
MTAGGEADDAHALGTGVPAPPDFALHCLERNGMAHLHGIAEDAGVQTQRA